MNTTQLECFMEVANFLNFSRAAEHLRITQPAVSHQINSLEDELGVKLFHRTSKSVRLTQEGFLFTQYAGEILKLSGLSKARVKQSQKVLPLRLGIGCRNVTELHLLRPALERLRQEQADLLPVLRLIPFDSLENLLTEGDIQLMFSFQGSGIKKARYRELVRCPVVCICAPEHPLASRPTVTLDQLRQAGRIAACRPPICPPPLFEIQHQAMGQRDPGQVLFCDNQETILTLVEAGFAFAVMAGFPQIHHPGLRYIPVAEVEPIPFGAVYLPGEGGPVLRRFLVLLEESLGQSPATTLSP